MMKKSNYVFRGKNVSIKQHWIGLDSEKNEYTLVDSKTGKDLMIGTLETIQREYDKRNGRNKDEPCR